MSSNADGNTDDTATFPVIQDSALERAIVAFLFALVTVFFLMLACTLAMTVVNECTTMRAQRDARLRRQRLDLDRDRFLRDGRQARDGGEEDIELAPLPQARVRGSGRRLSVESWEGDVAPPPPYYNPI